jgi:hypothetical protein
LPPVSTFQPRTISGIKSPPKTLRKRRPSKWTDISTAVRIRLEAVLMVERIRWREIDEEKLVEDATWCPEAKKEDKGQRVRERGARENYM